MFRTRFAPSPTGYMHIGNLRTALYAYLLAKKHKGVFILRIEDTDQSRNVPAALAAIYNGLALAGITYDEGPDKDGGKGPYVQSQRLPIYKKYAEELIAKGAAYYCFCQKEDKPEAEDQPAHPDVTRDPCRFLTEAEARARLSGGVIPVVRQRIPEGGSTSFDDHVYGRITIDNSQLDDQVLLKSDGFPTYNFANVVDDHLMEITHVIRGQEYLSSTPKYNLLYQAFGWQIPEYIHLPLILREDGAKLSKRAGDPSFEDLVNMGYLPEAIVNYVALLGWSPGNDREFFTMQDLIEAFDMDRIGKSSAAFSMDKLTWLNGEHIRAMDPAAFHQAARKYYPKDSGLDEEKISRLIQIRVEKLTDIPGMIRFLSELPEYGPELFENQKSKATLASSAEVLRAVIPLLQKLEKWDNESLFAALKDFAAANGYKTGTVMWPIRTSLSGLPASPGGATELADLLGKEETLRRLVIGLQKLES
ncbi:MAG: glutamate--tRNA ligase [Chloroflexi bacterium]|jgi:glutamyl-tRNA synthetase|nr:glutamate--tRNA ligase [Anaerolineaceae bacterium]NLI45283.1 glutamate--tRNA ligase [Chloroflexota bacterium]HOE34822.1 glutamate--tRNA ligase [Anaerolineaceae bacterium]HOT25277.1 glutamate--tRNA ligase [Anaerolineaceae bacterium]HQH57783.1 glutamate--tRNA ligase [Anaerolineaceae bacterium]